MQVTVPACAARLRAITLRNTGKGSAALVLCGFLAACEEFPKDYDLRGTIGAFNTSEAVRTATKDRPEGDDRGLITYPSYQVAVARRGDRVADVATRIGLPIAELAEYNGIEPSDELRKGEILALPRRAPDVLPTPEITPNTGTAAPGGVDIASLAGQAIEEAPLSKPNPGSVTPSTIRPKPKPTPRPSPVRVQNGPEPVRHQVKRGETAFTISRLYQVPVKALAEWNGLGSDFAIREGQYLLIPIKDQKPPQREAAAATVSAAAPAVTAPGVGSSTPVPPSASKPRPQENIAPAAVVPTPQQVVKVPEPTRKSEAAMVFPVQGKIIRAYSKGKNDGIDISGGAGSEVRAAAAGSVAAITEDSNGIPIIVVRHDAKLLSVYANVDNIKINKGDKVSRGQAIATLRDEPNPFVHFEIRNGFESVDPLPYLN
ncbi:Murein DD-endopeptidase MepM and murein hydrolase activator NlpD, contain LysM domain [Epibacterium ulvae]|uniref:Murein DD-endopeptidase MepM and murein hydrolase activator NlpD, contain LysM domain n=1 Tax=Epibacterium ulvae TaxID=1156985 RepID=A0A1G5QNR5_9RHOB|nr:M23 family metallopeptidase [Epibacterium ulvae]SCZ63377.1 Murein DD-endopeptidase MepM and murein hydrolase activator NlpD, contain LysM domain [Epibacterium ulvae]